MRPLVDAEKLESFLSEVGRHADSPTRVYLVGGAVALLRRWRASTVDIDLRIEPDSGSLMRALPGLKERLSVSLELASPLDFLPELPGWRERSRFLRQEGQAAIFELDLYSQALAKIERGFEQDRSDVRRMLDEGLVEPERLRELLVAILPELYRFPAVDAGALAEDLERALTEGAGEREA
jgi:hypothetical protein